MHKVLVAFTGPIGSGKDTLSIIMADELGGKVRKFASFLYSMAACIDPVFSPSMSHEEKEGFVLGIKELGTRRNYLQKLGTEFGRNTIHEDHWIILQDNLLETSLSPNFYSDCRFEGEAQLIRDRGGIVIHLKPNWIDSTNTSAAQSHSSEAGIKWQPGDYILGLSKGKVGQGVSEVRSIISDHFYPTVGVDKFSLGNRE